MSDRPVRIVHARPPAKRSAAPPAALASEPPKVTLSSSDATDAFIELLRTWKLPPARGWRMLTGLGYRAGSLTSGQIARVQHLLVIDAGVRSIFDTAAGEWMVTVNDSKLLASAAPVDFLTRVGTRGYAALEQQVSAWAKG